MIQNQRVDVAIVVVVAESRAAAGESLGDAGAHRCGNILELSVAQILVDETRILESLADARVLRFPDRHGR